MSTSSQEQQQPAQTTSFHQILILIALSLFGRGGAASLPDHVEEIVAKDRRAAAVLIAQEIAAETERHATQFVNLRTSLFSVAERYESTASDLTDVLSEGVGEAERIQMKLVDARFRLRDVMTAREWETLAQNFGN